MYITVGIGASAGGLEAFKSFFSAMPTTTGMAFVLVQHLSPDHKSMLAELLGRTTDMPVVEAADGMKIQPNSIFVIPPDSTMTISDGHLKVVKPAPPRATRRPIDTFFASLAEDQGENSVCIILSGTGSDGTVGAAFVKEKGGFTLAQAEYDSHALPGMPQSAAESGQVDDVLAVEDMPARLISYQAYLASVADGKDEHGLRKDAKSHLASILRALHARTGHDFREYKEKTILRRLQRRMQVLQVQTPEDYLARLTDTPEELDFLFRELLISVTHFFRDEAAFDALASLIIKPLVAASGSNGDIRVWVPGCATGEEAYTIAILLREAMDVRRPRPKIQIFGTDLDDRAVAVARLGRYRAPAIGLSDERAERWFTKEGDFLVVLPEIREMCIFSVHSAIRHPPFSKLDLISCRNLLIYLEPPLQDRLMRTFHYALKPGGTLFLGSSESVTRSTGLFSVRQKKHRIFGRLDAPVSLPPLSSTGGMMERAASGPNFTVKEETIERSLRRIMEKHNPPHLVVDSTNKIVRFSGGSMGEYLEPSPGLASLALVDLLRKALRPAAREILAQVRKGDGPVRRDDVPIRIDGKLRVVSLIAEPLAESGPDADLVVLILQDGGAVQPRAKGGTKTSEDMEAIQHELLTTKTQLQSSVDELETANEEMKSSNEEYQSVNEELQSSNEELETAKEEMQSVNEELQTINVEIAGKNEQLTQLNSDLSNLLESTDIATLFLDDALRVRRFTRGINDVLPLRESDIGRPVTEIVSELDYDELQRDVKSVLRKLTPVEREVVVPNSNATFILRIRPYRTVDNVIDGVVLTFVDISARQVAYAAVRESETRFRLLFDNIDEGFCMIEKVRHPDGLSDYRYLYVNAAFEEQSGLDNVLGKTIRGVMPEVPAFGMDTLDGVWDTGQPIRFTSETPSVDRVIEAFAFRYDEPTGPKLAVIFRDVSARTRHAIQQDLLLREMDHRVKNLFAVIGGVVSLSGRSAKTPQELTAKIRGRLAAMAGAHQLVRPHGQAGVAEPPETTLAEIVETVLSPHSQDFSADEKFRLTSHGPDVRVRGDAVTSLAMVLHELGTNAAKYGAFSVPKGQVAVSWSVADGELRIVWTENGGPEVMQAPDTLGFGSVLARNCVESGLQGALDFDWRPEGLIVRISVSLERIQA